MKKETRLLKQMSLNSLTLSIDHFNRQWDSGQQLIRADVSRRWVQFRKVADATPRRITGPVTELSSRRSSRSRASAQTWIWGRHSQRQGDGPPSPGAGSPVSSYQWCTTIRSMI